MGYHPSRMSVPPEALRKALSKITAALEGSGHKPVAIGAIARQAWGAKRAAEGLELLTPSGAAHRDAILGAARGEGFRQEPGAALRLTLNDTKVGTTVSVDVIEAATPFHAQVIGRAQPGVVAGMNMKVATCEDLLLLSPEREALIELLRANAGRIDGAYLKREAEAAGIFDRIKAAWQEAKAQG